MQIPDIKNNLPITKVLAHYNIKIDKNNHIKCPFHQDDKPSCKIYLDTNSYHCFGCGKTGDIIQFIQDKEKCGKHEALNKAKELINGSIGTVQSQGLAPQSKTKEDYTALFSDQQNQLGTKAQEYIRYRGLENIKDTRLCGSSRYTRPCSS